jgi:GNAT superfamily N-acetyltransferase
VKKSLKAVLFSGLVFPGSGYFVLRLPVRGLVVVALALVSLVELVSVAMAQATFVMNKVMTGDVPMDANGIESLVTTASAASSTSLADLASWVLLACWIISTIDCYRIGRKLDLAAVVKTAGDYFGKSPRSPAVAARSEYVNDIARQFADAVMPVVRVARMGELPQLLELYRHLHASDAELPAQEIVAGTWQAMLGNPAIRVLVAVVDETPVATATLVIVPNLTRGARSYALIENVVTDRAWRKRGIGTHLLRAAQQMAWGVNCYKVMLMTGSKKEETLSFYRGAGFVDGDKTGFVARPE